MNKIKNKKLTASSKKWISRQLNDPYVIQAKKLGYRSRAAFKIIEIQDKFKLIKHNSFVLDLGASPGGWSQIVAPICKKLIAVDLLPMLPLPNVSFIQGDFLNSIEKIKCATNGKKLDIILSDMAPNVCGIQKVDHLRIINIIEQVIDFANSNLCCNGSLVMKAFQGAEIDNILRSLKLRFSKVSMFKPKSSRKESPEMYIIAQLFKS